MKITVHISETFSISAIIKEYVRNEEYLILLLSQGYHLAKCE